MQRAWAAALRWSTAIEQTQAEGLHWGAAPSPKVAARLDACGATFAGRPAKIRSRRHFLTSKNGPERAFSSQGAQIAPRTQGGSP